MTAKKKSKKKPIPRPSRNVSNGKKKKPEAELARNTKKYGAKRFGVSLSKLTYGLIAKRARTESTAAGHSISTSKLVETLIVEYLDGLEGARKIDPADEYAAAKIVIGGFTVKDRGIEGPFIHVDSKGRVTRAGFVKTPGLLAANDGGHRLAGEKATRSRNVEDGPLVQHFENSEFDPTSAEDSADEEREEIASGHGPDAEDVEAEEQAADEERVADAHEFGEDP